MALIGKIREKSVLLVIVIFVALMAFVLGDWQSFSGASGEVIGVGKIAGESVDPEVYNEAVNNFLQQAQQQAQQQQKEFTEKDRQDARNRAWTYIVESSILNSEIEKLGLAVGPNEFNAYLFGQEGFDVMPDLAQNFRDSLGRFNPKMLEARIEQMENSEDANEKQSWEESKAYYTERRLQEKYFALLNQGVYVTKAEAEEEYLSQKEKKSVSIVMKRYTDTPDEEIKITDEEMREYYEAHKNEKKFEADQASRELQYFDVKIAPSAKDRQKFDQDLAKLKEEFKKTKNDSLFVMTKSEPAFRFYSSTSMATFLPEGAEKARQGLTYPATMDSVFTNAQVGDVIGPYVDNDKTRLAKVVGFNSQKLSARHILLSAQRTDTAKVETTKKLADSLLRVINSGNFESFVSQYSEDPGSKDKGGLYEDFFDYEMVPEFSGFVKNNPVGKIGVVQTDYGFHIMEVMGKESIKHPILAIVQKTLKASQETIESKDEEVYDLLYQIDNAISDIKDAKQKVEVFDSLARKAGYIPRPTVITENQPTLYGFNTSFAEDKMIKLAFDPEVEVGNLCSSPIKDKDRYVIAMVSKKKEKGVPAFEDHEGTMRNELILEKKAKRYIALMNGSKNLDQLADKLNEEVKKAEITFGATTIQGIGFEPEVIGSVFSALKDGQTTVPLKGRNGVYVVRLDKTTKAPATNDYTAEKETMMQTTRQSAASLAKNALKEKADVIDNRRFNAIGLRR